MQPRFELAFTVAVALCLVTPAQAQSTAQSSAPSAAESMLRRPTDFRSRAEVRNEYQDLERGGYRNLLIPRFEYAVNPGVALRLETPYVTYHPGGNGHSVSGQGDLLARGAWRAIQRDGFALTLANDVIFDTARERSLGFGKTIVAPQVYAAIDLPKRNSVFFPSIQHYVSVAGASGRDDIHFSSIKPMLLTRWPNKVYTFLEPQFTIDWERDAKTGLTVELEIGKILTGNVAAWARPGIGALNSDELPFVYEWNFEVGMRYIF